MPIRSGKHVIEFYGVSHVSKVRIYEVRYVVGRGSIRELPIFTYRIAHAQSFAWGTGCDKSRGYQLSFAILYTYQVKVLAQPDLEETAELLTMDIYDAFYKQIIVRLPTPGWTLNMKTIESFLTSFDSTT